MEKKQYYYTHKYLDKTGKRCSIVAEMLSPYKFIITEWKASPKDKFLKKKSFAIKEDVIIGYLTVPEIKEKHGVTVNSFMIDIQDEIKPKASFLAWVRNNYYTNVTVYQPKTKLVRADLAEYHKVLNLMHTRL